GWSAGPARGTTRRPRARARANPERRGAGRRWPPRGGCRARSATGLSSSPQPVCRLRAWRRPARRTSASRAALTPSACPAPPRPLRRARRRRRRPRGRPPRRGRLPPRPGPPPPPPPPPPEDPPLPPPPRRPGRGLPPPVTAVGQQLPRLDVVIQRHVQHVVDQ